MESFINYRGLIKLIKMINRNNGKTRGNVKLLEIYKWKAVFFEVVVLTQKNHENFSIRACC